MAALRRQRDVAWASHRVLTRSTCLGINGVAHAWSALSLWSAHVLTF